MQITKKLISTNFGKGRKDTIQGVIIHTEGLATPIAGTADRDLFNGFNNPASKVSAHYNILFSGKIVQFVEEWDTAWHAGPGENGRTIGVEMQDNGRWQDAGTYTEAQYRAFAELLLDLHHRYGIMVHHGLKGVRPHREVSQRACPGAFNWEESIRMAWNMEPSSNPNFEGQVPTPNGKPITVAIQKGWGFSHVANAAGWPILDPNRTFEKLKALNPDHPAIKRGKLWANDKPLIVGYEAVVPVEPTPIPGPTPTPVDVIRELREALEVTRGDLKKANDDLATWQKLSATQGEAIKKATEKIAELEQQITETPTGLNLIITAIIQWLRKK